MDLNNLKICTKCALPETFPGISFNEEGVCNHCQKFATFAATDEQRIEYQERLASMIADYDDRDVQILMAYSGGKDSTYSMKLLKEKYGARIMSFTFDNGFISDQAQANINRVCDALDIRHMNIKYDQNMLDKLFRYAADNEMYPQQTMERASTICTMCSGFFKSVAMATALDNRIPFMGYGWSPGQAPIQSALSQSNPRFVKMAQANVIKPVVNVIGEDATKYFLQPHHYEVPAEDWPVSIHPLAFEEYDEDAIKEEIRKIGWIDPTDVDSNSTNCTMNAFANEVHIKRYGFHPYVQELSNMVRNGTMSREDAIEKIYTPQNPTLVNYAIERIGLRVE